MEALKIRSHINPILELVRKNPLVTVTAPTGTGKSLGIPWAVAKTKSKIFVSVPTIISAISLAETFRRYTPQIKVGYAAEGRINYDEQTQVVYATSGHLRLKILRGISEGKCDLSFAKVIMIDEYHLHKADNDIIYGIWTHCRQQGQPVPRMILASATPDPSLSGATYEVKTESYPISVEYVNSKGVLDDTVQYARRLSTSSTSGHILVFLPGASEVERAAKDLRIPTIPNARIYTAYSEMSKEAINRIYEKVPPNVRKIIVATNVLETSITIPDVGIVIDSMLEKRAETSPAGGLHLVTTEISRDSATQRCGRTGRTRAGVCYRMLSEFKYNQLEPHTPKEIVRVPLYRYVMEIITTGLDPYKIFPTEVSSKVAKSIGLLYNLGLVQRETNQITPGGQFVFDLPMDVRMGAVLYRWLDQDLPAYPGIVVSTLIDNWGPSYFFYPRRHSSSDVEFNDKVKEFNAKISKFKSEQGSLGMLIKLWNDLMNYQAPRDLDLNLVYEWSQENAVNFKVIKEGLYRIRQISLILTKKGYQIDQGPFTEQGVVENMAPLLDQVYEDLSMTVKSTQGQILYYHPGTRKDYVLDIREQYLTPKSINSIIVTEITNRLGRTTRFISFYSVRGVQKKSQLGSDQQSALEAALAAL